MKKEEIKYYIKNKSKYTDRETLFIYDKKSLTPFIEVNCHMINSTPVIIGTIYDTKIKDEKFTYINRQEFIKIFKLIKSKGDNFYLGLQILKEYTKNVKKLLE